MLSVHPLAAVHGATVARDLVLVVLEVELVVVAELPMAKTQSEKGRRRPRRPAGWASVPRGRERDRGQKTENSPAASARPQGAGSPERREAAGKARTGPAGRGDSALPANDRLHLY